MQQSWKEMMVTRTRIDFGDFENSMDISENEIDKIGDCEV